MGLFSWMWNWLGWEESSGRNDRQSDFVDETRHPETSTFHGRSSPGTTSVERPARTRPKQNRAIHLTPSRHRRIPKQLNGCREVTGSSPYRFARFGSRTGSYLDLSDDGDDSRLRRRGLPIFHNPEQLAQWLDLPLNKLAWLVHRFSAGHPTSVAKAHYHFSWVKKHSGGVRLIESPKQTLKQVQVKILREILDRVPPHPAAHGFTTGRSTLTNAAPHAGHAVLLKLDLANFYASVGFSRVVAIFRTMGYSREAAIWLGLLTTSALPGNMPFEGRSVTEMMPYWRRHLPQGAPTSPALANLSAYRLDLRLSGLARSFNATFTRYADDLSLSGSKGFGTGLRVFIPLVQQIVRKERFRCNQRKRQVLRSHQRQTIAGVVINEKANVSRADFDTLKAILTNCIRLGPSTQNRFNKDDFASHLRGRIAHVMQLNMSRGSKLLNLYRKIDWRR